MTNKKNVCPIGQESVSASNNSKKANVTGKKKVHLSKETYEKLKAIAALKGESGSSVGDVLDGILDDYFDGRNDTVAAIKEKQGKTAIHLTRENYMMLESIAEKEKNGNTIGNILNSIVKNHLEKVSA